MQPEQRRGRTAADVLESPDGVGGRTIQPLEVCRVTITSALPLDNPF